MKYIEGLSIVLSESIQMKKNYIYKTKTFCFRNNFS